MDFGKPPKFRDELASFSADIRRAFESVPRDRFIPKELRKYSDENTAIPLDEGSSISQPSMIAYMLEALELDSGMKVLEIGSGCGYVLALLCEIGIKPTGVEIIESLAVESRETLKSLGYEAKTLVGNAQALEFDEKFDRILFSAAVRDVPTWAFDLLEEGGFIVCPFGREDSQEMVVMDSNKIKRTGIICRFVPFVG